jgi:hypothetical protein
MGERSDACGLMRGEGRGAAIAERWRFDGGPHDFTACGEGGVIRTSVVS